MNRIFTFFVDNWKFSILTTLFVLIIGSLSFTLLQRESFPPVNFAVVVVTTVFPGASPEEVQDKVTQVVEDELRAIAGIKDVKSVSQSNLSSITIRVDIDGAESGKVVSDIQKAVQRASSKLPDEVTEEPLVTEINAREIPVLEFAITGDNSDRKRDLLADKLKAEIEDVKGISSVSLSAYQDRELQVLLNQGKLKQFGIGLDEVFRALSQQIKNIPSGYIDNKETKTLVRVFGKKIKTEDLENVVVRSNDAGANIRIKDIGQVKDASKKPTVIARVNGEEATIVTITKKADADALKTLDAAAVRIEAFKQGLDKAYSLVVFNDEGARIKNRLEIVSYNAISGMVIVLLVLFILLPGKVGFFSSLSLPICAVATIGVLVFFGANFNIITMIALVICLGNLVDNSVVISENYIDLVESGMAPRLAAIKSAKQFWIPFTASTITIIAAFLPMLVTKGVMGQFIKWIPITITAALTISLVESLTILPARLQFLKTRPKTQSKGGWFEVVEKLFGKLIGKTLQHKYLTLFLLSCLVASGFFVTAFLNRFELFPANGVEYYIGRVEVNADSSIYNTDGIVSSLSKSVSETLDKDVLLAIVGRSGVSQTDPSDPKAKVGDNVGMILIAIKPDKAPDLNIQKTLESLKAIPSPVGVTKLSFEPLEGGPPIGKPLTVTLRSDNYQQLSGARDSILEDLKQLKGVFNLEDDEQSTGREFLFVADEESRAFSGTSVDAIGLNLRTALEGSTAARLSEFGKEFDLVVSFDQKSRDDIQDLQKIELLTSRGNVIPLTSLGKFNEVDAPKAIKNFDFKQSITITADVDNILANSQSVNLAARDAFQKVTSKYPLVSAVFGGEEESTNESLQSLGIALLLALFGIFATLVFTFGSFSNSFLVLSTIPLGLVGVFYSFTMIQRPLSFLAFIGVVGLTGVVINSAIILVDYIRELQAENKFGSMQELLVFASRKRLRAVLATGLTTVVGLLPSALGLGGYDAILVDITLALSWGMIIGTLLSLIWIPVGFLIINDFKNYWFKTSKT